MAELPSSLGSYRVQHQLGVGTLGPVFLASDEVLHVTAAVKVFDVDATPEQVAALVQRLNATAARLSSHPGIIKLFEAGVASHVAYLATEHAEGMPLDARLRERDASLPAESLGWLEAIAEAIDTFHADGVDHGALHPRDIVLSLDGPRVSGCGVVRAVEDVGLRAPVRLPYTAPERAAGPSWGRAADIFSLAVIAFECLAGARPTGTGRAAAERLPPTVSPEYDRALADVFARALSADAERRPSSARAFVQGLLDAGAAYVYGGDAKRGAVHHRTGTMPRPPAKPAAAPAGGREGVTEDGDLARFARDGVLPAAPLRQPARRRPKVPAERRQAPEPTDSSDPLTLFQPESNEPEEVSASDESREKGAKRKRGRRAKGSRSPGAPETPEVTSPVSSSPTDLQDMPNGSDAGTVSDEDAVAGADTTEAYATKADAGEADAAGADAAGADAAGADAAGADTVADADMTLAGVAMGGLLHASTQPPDDRRPADNEEYESPPSVVQEEEDVELYASADTRAEPEGWLASTVAVPLVDAQEEVEYPAPMPDLMPDARAEAAVPGDRFLDVDGPNDHRGRREGPNELGDGAQGDPEAFEGARDVAVARSSPVDAAPDSREVELSLDDRAPLSATSFGATRLFRDDEDEWEDRPDDPRKRRFVRPLLFLLLVAVVAAWYYGAWAPPLSTVPPDDQQVADTDAVGTPSGESGESDASGESGQSAQPPPEVARSDERAATAAAPSGRESRQGATTRDAATTRSAERGSAARATDSSGGQSAGGDRGRLLVRTSPSATVTIDGVPRGTSPAAVYALDWGVHTVVVSRPGYADVTRRVMVAPDSPAVAVTIDLLRAEAPSGSQSGAAGSPASEPETAATSPPPAPAGAGTGAIVAVTRPTGAQVSVDGRSVGTTPATIPNVPAGTHTVGFELAGYRGWETRVMVEAGQRARIAASLDRDR